MVESIVFTFVLKLHTLLSVSLRDTEAFEANFSGHASCEIFLHILEVNAVMRSLRA